MDLKEYLFRNNITATDFAKQVGCARAYITCIRLGTCIPSPKLALEIEKATNNSVRALHFARLRKKKKLAKNKI